MKSTRLQKYLGDSKKKKSDKNADTAKQSIPAKKSLSVKKPFVKKDDDEVILMDMPEVKDIPGQENIRPPHMREMMDVTISSADEEGEGLLDDLNKEDDDDELMNANFNVSTAERTLLAQADRPVTDEVKDRKKLSLDKTDGNDKLNEESDPQDMGEGLDVPGAELDDKDEKLGEEDEENNSYSRPD